MNSRKLAGASAASVGAATAVAALLLGTLSGSAGEEPTASAFGIAADGLIHINPTPYVEAPPPDSDALLELPGSGEKRHEERPGPNKDGIYVALLKVEAENFRSKATAVKVNILGLRLKVLEATCDNGHGDSSIISTDGDGGSSPYSGQSLDLSPVVSVEFNRQHRDHDELTVDAAVIKLLPGGNHGRAISDKDLTDLRKLAPSLKVPEKKSDVKTAKPGAVPTVGDLVTQLKVLNPSLKGSKGDDDALLTVVISSATCKERHEHKQQKEEAPPPKPVESNLPVTH